MSTSGASTELAISRGDDMRRAYQGSDAGGEPGQAALADGLGTRLGPAATFATTEHFNLQTARAITVSEANGRASIYLAALSGNLIALAFVGQISRLGAAFYAFALILLPVLAFVGVVTFLRRDRTGPAVLERVRRDVRSGSATGQVTGTPTLFIDGVVHRGSYKAAALLEVLAPRLQAS